MQKVPMFEKLMFSTRTGRLNSRDVDYWRNMFSKILKVGEEYEVVVPDNLSLDRVFHQFREQFSPTHSTDIVGEYGIYDVKQDGSVPHGMELVTVGRRFNWKTFYEMNKKIMDTFQEHDFYTTHNTGMHIHLLSGYSNEYGLRELERNVPELILANYYQLHRIFAPELFWLASGGAERHAITRYIVFRQPPFELTPLSNAMRQIQSAMNDRYGKYQMINLNPVGFANRDIERFHVEIRHPDTHLSPAYATALVGLEVAMLNKAIDLCQCGIISMQQDEYEFRKKLFSKFANMGTGDRDSDSSDLTDEDIDLLGQMTSDMIRWFKSEILGVSSVAYEILQKIAVTPASMMRIGGKNWRMIEEYIYPQQLVDSEKIDKLNEIIVTQQITDCDDQDNWKIRVSDRMSVPLTKVNELIEQIGRERIVVWDTEIGSMLYKQIV